MKDIVCRPIGVIHSPNQHPEETPIQPTFAEGIRGQVEVFAEFEEGLVDLEGFSHVYLLYRLHRAGEPRLTVVPYLGREPHGVYATRHPARPNAIGLGVVRLLGREGGVLDIEDVDILDGTPLLDIKPWVPRFEPQAGADMEAGKPMRTGWLESVDEDTARSRGRRERSD